MKKEIRKEILNVASKSNSLLRAERKEQIRQIFDNSLPSEILAPTTTLRFSYNDILYRELNLNYLKSQGLLLSCKNHLTKFGYCEDSNSMELFECYFSSENFILIVRHHLKQVKILSNDLNTGFDTLVFIDVMNEVLFCDNCEIAEKIGEYYTALSISDAERTLLSKEFKIAADLKNRNFEIHLSPQSKPIITTMNHLDDIIKQLYTLLGNDNPKYYADFKGDLKIETRFIEEISEKNTVYHQISIIDSLTSLGTFSRIENFKKYEIIFKVDIIKVKVILYLTDLDIKQKMLLTNEDLKASILSESDEMATKYMFNTLCVNQLIYTMYNNYYDEYLIDTQIFRKLKDMFSRSMVLQFVSYEDDLFKNTFGRIFIQKMDFSIADISTESFYCREIQTNIIQFRKPFLENLNYFLVRYNEKFYLVKLSCKYLSIMYDDSVFSIAIPIFIVDNIFDISIKCITTYGELISSLDNPDAIFNFTKTESNTSSFTDKNEMDIVSFIKSNFKDFKIIKNSEIKLEYLNSDVDTIYSKLISRILKCDSITSQFFVGECFSFCDDEDRVFEKITLLSNGISYGYYKYQPSKDITINTAMGENSKLSSNDNLISTIINEGSLGFSTTFHELLDNTKCTCSYNKNFSKLKTINEYSKFNLSLYDICITKILEEN